jgi:hypothetical protein
MVPRHNTKGLNALRNTAPDIMANMFQRKSVTDIALTFGVSVTAARSHLESLGLRRSLSEANRVRYRKAVTYLTVDQEQVVYGSLLGDACLYRQDKRTHFTLKVGFAHGADQLPYLRFKRIVMGGSRISRRPEGSNWGKPVYQFSYSNTQGLLPVESVVVKHGRKAVGSEWLAKLSWFGLAIWYQDDASLIFQNGKPSCIRWYTNSFTRPEVDLLCDMLRTRGLKSISVAHGNTPSEPVITVYRRSDICEFVHNLQPFSIPCLHYKFKV